MNQYVQEALDLTKQLIEAATPIVKQAYEIGLLTLRIDAAQDVVCALGLLIFGSLGLWKVIKDVKEAKRTSQLPENIHKSYNDLDKYLTGGGVFHFFGGFAALAAFGFGVVQTLSLWMWVKLFSPELWLAHQAIEKLTK